MSRFIKEEMAHELPPSSPTIPQTSSRAQTVGSQTPAPVNRRTDSPSQATMADSDTTMNGTGDETLDHHEAMQSLGAHSHRLIQGIKKLEGFNINATLPSLPKFVVVGDQSAGKSSIVEALCDISLPRNQGTCTRCPFLISTSSQISSAQWAASISIKQSYYFNPRQGRSQWYIRDGAIVTHFATVTEKQELDIMLRRAQIAVLNPKDNPRIFDNIDLHSAAGTPRQVAFSPNVICLEIQGPDLPELSFYDLPGSINVIEDDEDPGLVSMIEGLVKGYIQDEKSRILLACGADQDIETSTTFRYIKDCKATSRCAGVLTKADLLQSGPGKAKYIQQLLGGKKFILGQGWYITKQLSQAEVDDHTDHAEARRREAEFFRREPWASFHDLQDRFGIPHLQGAVSRGLTDHIRSELPEILARVKNRLDEVHAQLELFPDRPTHPTYTVISEIQKLATTIADHVKGESDVNLFRNDFLEIVTNFKKVLLKTKPTLEMKTPGWQVPALSLLSDGDDAPDATPTPLPVRASVTPSSRKRPHNNNINTTTPSSRRIKPDPATPAIQKSSYTLESLRSEYERGSISGVPGSVNSKVTDRLILQTLKGWTGAVDRLLSDADAAVRDLIAQAMDQDMSTRSSTQFYVRTQNTLTDLITQLVKDESDRIRYLLACEQEKPVTFSKWDALKNSRIRDFHASRALQRTKEHFETLEADKPRSTPQEKRAEKAKDAAWVQANLGDDEWKEVIESAARISAYYDTAAMCFVDTVAKNLEFGLLRPLRLEVAPRLFEELRTTDEGVCAELLAEDPERERLRAGLGAERARLQQALDELVVLSEV